MYGKRLNIHTEAATLQVRDQAAPVGIFIVQDGIIRQANAGLAQMFGFQSPEDMVDCVSCSDLVAVGDRELVADYLRQVLLGTADLHSYRFSGLRCDGSSLKVELHGCAVEHNQRPAVIGVLMDVGHYSRLEEEIERRESYDDLTGLPGKALLFDRINQAIAQAQRDDELLAFLVLGLDGFKAINDRFGPLIGDNVLRIAAERFAGTLRASDTLARLVGDQFGVLASGLLFGDEVALVAKKLCDVLVSPISLEGREIRLGVSIGIAVFPSASDDAEGLVRAAKAAMYLVKQEKRGSYFFSLSSGISGDGTSS